MMWEIVIAPTVMKTWPHLGWLKNYLSLSQGKRITVKPLILATLNFGIWVNLIILDPVILAFLLPTTLKRYCIQISAARYFRKLVRLAKFVK